METCEYQKYLQLTEYVISLKKMHQSAKESMSIWIKEESSFATPKLYAYSNVLAMTSDQPGQDSSNQNGPVERAHLTIGNAICAMLLGAGLPVKFWPYAFHHYLRIMNSTPSRD